MSLSGGPVPGCASAYDSALRVHARLLRTYEAYDSSVQNAYRAACAAAAHRLAYALQVFAGVR